MKSFTMRYQLFLLSAMLLISFQLVGQSNICFTVQPIEFTYDPVDCTLDTLSVNVVAQPGQTGLMYDYQWQEIGTDEEWQDIMGGTAATYTELEGIPEGTYRVVVTLTNPSENCQSSTVIESTPVDNAPPTLTTETSGNILSCPDGTLQLEVEGVPGNQGLYFEWDGPNGFMESGDNLNSVTVTTPGVYTVTVRIASDGCLLGTESFAVFDFPIQAVVNPGMTTLGCDENESLLLPGSVTGIVNDLIIDLKFSWLRPNGVTVNGVMPTISNPTAGTYTFTILDDFSGCSSSADFTVLPASDLPIADAGPDQELTCELTEVNLGGTNTSTGDDLTYEWTSSGPGNIIAGANTANATVNATGVYTFTVSRGENCSVTDQVLVTENIAEADFELNVAEVYDLCEGESLQLSDELGEAIDVNWEGPMQTTISGSTITADEGGTYTISGLHPVSGCPGSQSVNVVLQEKPVLTLATATSMIDNIIQVKDDELLQIDFMVEPIGTVQWELIDRDDINEEESSFSIEGTGSIRNTRFRSSGGRSPGQVIYQAWTSNSGCSSDTLQIIVRIYPASDDPEDCFFIPEVLTPNGDGVNETFDVQFLCNSSDAYRLEVFNRSGALVFSNDSMNIPWRPVNCLDGTYIVRIIPADGGAVITQAITILTR